MPKSYFCSACGSIDFVGSHSDENANCTCGADAWLESDDVITFDYYNKPLLGVVLDVVSDKTTRKGLLYVDSSEGVVFVGKEDNPQYFGE